MLAAQLNYQKRLMPPSAVSAKTVPGITVAVTVVKNVNGDNSADVFALTLQTLSYYHQDH
ncbi:hypothetical protein [Pseudoalteromonas lipolytica]|uniref:Uncharacterized protein n=1 Tax=Pseudoalteromonas lipolytica TaxID=570156 RepID=A0A0P7D5V1_9GAMM|nr:hypothetical protein [Pseudoalteromonas lipolytica]KPM83998.1 hypothetical protein AOG27_06725 [Pseudoalteromonas lipolytica]